MNRGSGVIWIIDGAYVLKGARGKIDYMAMRRELQQWASDGQHFDRCIYFNSRVPGDEAQEQFHKLLAERGFEVRLYDLKLMNVHCEHCRQHGKRQVQKGVDVGICTAMLASASTYKRVILSAGDGDFADACRAVRDQFKEVFVHGYRDSMSSDLSSMANAMFYG